MEGLKIELGSAEEGSFLIPLSSHDQIPAALELAISAIRKLPGWERQVLRKYHFQIFPHDSFFGPPSFQASLMVGVQDYLMPWEKTSSGEHIA